MYSGTNLDSIYFAIVIRESTEVSPESFSPHLSALVKSPAAWTAPPTNGQFSSRNLESAEWYSALSGAAGWGWLDSISEKRLIARGHTLSVAIPLPDIGYT